MNSTYDVLIVGNGILGLSTAYMLHSVEPTIKIAVVGPDDHRGAASVAAGAMLGCFGEITTTSQRSKHHKIKFEMAREALSLWPSWLQELNSFTKQPVNIGDGTFVLNNAVSGVIDDENYSMMRKVLQEYHEPYETVSTLEIPGFNPVANHRSLQALYIPREGHLNPREVIKLFYQWIQQCDQVDIIHKYVAQINTIDSKVTGVTLSDNECISSKHIVLTAGAFSHNLIENIPTLKNKIPHLFYGLGNAILLEHPEMNQIKHVIRTPNRSFACGLHVLPRGHNTLYVGATNNIILKPEFSPRAGLVNFLSSCFLEQINHRFHTAKITGFEVGHRPVGIDTFPLIGQTSVSGFWLATGTYRDGFLQSPLIAKELANQIIGAPTKFIQHFKPERKPINTYTKQQAISESVRHYLAGASEHQVHMPKIGWDDMYEELMTLKVTSIYDSLPDEFILPPDMILLFGEDPENMNFMKTYLTSLNHRSVEEV